MMNVLSLPDEMIASFTKYMNYEECERVRKMNQRINSVAKKYKLNRMDLEKITMLRYGNIELVASKKNRNSKFFNKNGQLVIRENVDNIEKLLNMTRRVESLCLFIKIDEETLGMFSQHSKTVRIKTVWMVFCTISVSAEKLKDFANTMKVKWFAMYYVTFEADTMFTLTDEVISNFDPSIYLQFNTFIDAPRITLKGLQSRVFSNILMLSLAHCKTGITFEDMKRFLKENKTIETNMCFGILSKQDLNRQSVEDELKECGFTFEDATIEHNCRFVRNGATIYFDLIPGP